MSSCNDNNNLQTPECSLSLSQSSLDFAARRATILSAILSPLPMPVWLRSPDFHPTTGTLNESNNFVSNVLDEALEVALQLDEHIAICMMDGGRSKNSAIQTRGDHHVRQ
jgi:hypothetical protein